MLATNLPHIESDQDFEDLLKNNENVMLCCGRMGPMCLPVYDIMEEIASDYPNVAFCDMDFDGPASNNVRRLPAVRGFMGLPFTVYFHNGDVVEATSSIQNAVQITRMLDKHFQPATS